MEVDIDSQQFLMMSTLSHKLVYYEYEPQYCEKEQIINVIFLHAQTCFSKHSANNKEMPMYRVLINF